MTLWRFLVSQDVPGIVLATYLSAIPIGSWIHRVTERRHRDRIAAIRATSTQEKP